MKKSYNRFYIPKGDSKETNEGATQQQVTFEKAPMFWDLIKAAEYLLMVNIEGNPKNYHFKLCVIFALYKIAYTKRRGRITAPYSLIARLSGLSNRTVMRTIGELEKIGLISVKRGGQSRKPNTYTLVPVLLNEPDKTSESTPAALKTPDQTNNSQAQQTTSSKPPNQVSKTIQSQSGETAINDDDQSLLLLTSDAQLTAVSSADNNSPADSSLLSDGHTIKNNNKEISFFKHKYKESNKKEDDNKKNYSPNKTNRTQPCGVKINYLKPSNRIEKGEIYLDPRTIMVQITMLRKKVDEINSTMSDLRTDGSFSSDKDKQKYYALKDVKNRIMNKLDILYEAVGLDELKQQPATPQNNTVK